MPKQQSDIRIKEQFYINNWSEYLCRSVGLFLDIYFFVNVLDSFVLLFTLNIET